MIVTIDGPAGSGKSTVARKLAARLEIAYLDTGAMYRAIAHAALARRVDLQDASAVLALAESIDLDLSCGPTHTRVQVDGHDVSEAIRTMEVSKATSQVAKHPAIRTLLINQQRSIGSKLGSLVTEGRDQGSMVFPRSQFKFVLEASLAKRAERRYRELISEAEDVDLAAVMDDLSARDRVDAKQWAPLLKERSAVVIDTTEMTLGEVVDRLVEHIQSRQDVGTG
jgi:cytidylate kinase